MKPGIIRNKNFILLAQGLIVSNIGNAIHMVAVSWFILDVVGKEKSGFMLSLFYICNLLPLIVLGPVSGVIVDRINRKMIIYGTDVIRGILLLILAVLTYFNIFPLPSLFILTVLGAVFFTFFNPAVSSTIPNIVHPNDLVKANSINGMSFQISLVIGAAVSGFLYNEVGIIGVYVLNGVSFIASGISELFIKIPQLEFVKNTKFNFIKDLKEGIDYVKNDKASLGLLLLALFFNFFTQPLITIMIPKVIKYTMQLNAEYLGIFQSVAAVASIVGMILITRICKKNINHFKVLCLSLLIMSLVTFLYALPIIPAIVRTISGINIFFIYCVLGFFFMFFNSLINVPLSVILQKRTPDQFRGRFFALLTTGCAAAAPLGSLIFGTLSDYIIPAIIMALLGICLIAVSFVSVKSQNLKSLYDVKEL